MRRGVHAAKLCDAAESIHLVGDFSDWDTGATPLTKNQDGHWETRLDLEPGHQFKYLVNRQIGRNDLEADGPVNNPFGSRKLVVFTVLTGRVDRPRSRSVVATVSTTSCVEP